MKRRIEIIEHIEPRYCVGYAECLSLSEPSSAIKRHEVKSLASLITLIRKISHKQAKQIKQTGCVSSLSFEVPRK